MKELLNGITLEMGEDEVLCAILNEIIARAEPDVAEAIRFCAIPHWFNEEIIAWLRGEGLKPSRRSHEILAALTELSFVGPYRERGWAYHENMRDLLLRRWREGDGEEFMELRRRAAGYFAHKLGAKEAPLGRLRAAVRRVWGKVEMPTGYLREEYQRELMYHLLTADPGQGFKLFRRMFGRAYRFRQFGICALLFQLAEEQRGHLSADDLLWLRFHQGQLAQASAQWPEALMTFEGPCREKLVLSLKSALANELGLLYQAKGEWERAIAYYERGLTLKEKVGNEYGMAPTFHNLGLVYQYKGNLDKAIEYHERSLAIVEKIGDEHGMSCIFNSLGDVYQAKGEWEWAIDCYERAIDCYERSLAIREKVGDEHEMVGTLNNLGLVYQAKGEWERAMECYERNLTIWEKVGDEHGMAFSYNNIADLHQDQGRLQEAVPLFQKSVEILEQIGDQYHAKIGRKNLAKAKQELEAKKGQI
jgi:tetratricopeptide (TPR) repeat protein